MMKKMRCPHCGEDLGKSMDIGDEGISPGNRKIGIAKKGKRVKDLMMAK